MSDAPEPEAVPPEQIADGVPASGEAFIATFAPTRISILQPPRQFGPHRYEDARAAADALKQILFGDIMPRLPPNHPGRGPGRTVVQTQHHEPGGWTVTLWFDDVLHATGFCGRVIPGGPESIERPWLVVAWECAHGE